jgi:leader peptidase (prepilin peptidase) / N-methyltransferase
VSSAAAAGAAALGLVGLGAGVFVNLLVERVPDKLPLLPIGRSLRPSGAREWFGVALTGGLWAAAAIRFGADPALPAYLVFFTSLVAISIVDLDLHLIPNRIVYPTIFLSVPLLAVAALVDGDFDPYFRGLLGGALAFLALFVVWLVYPAGMGFGDVRMAFVLGLFLGWQSLGHVLVGIFCGFLLGAVVGVVLVAFRIRGRKDAIPFGPFLAAGAAVTVLVGDPLVRWWLG